MIKLTKENADRTISLLRVGMYIRNDESAMGVFIDKIKDIKYIKPKRCSMVQTIVVKSEHKTVRTGKIIECTLSNLSSVHNYYLLNEKEAFLELL